MPERAGIRMTPLPVSGGLVAQVTIDNAARLNALNSALLTEFAAIIDSLHGQEALRAVVVTGAGERAFVGGADLTELGRLDGPAAAEAFITRVHQACDALRRLPVPVIARLRGHCLGAGLELAAACDLRLADTSARFGMPEVRVGVPSVVEAALLPTLIGWGQTRRLLLLGETIDADEALAIGLIERLVAPDALDRAVEDWVAQILAGGVRAIRLQKALIARWERLPLAEAITAGIAAFGEAYGDDEPRRMVADHFARRRRG